MGLDKWLKPGDANKNSKKKIMAPERVKKARNDKETNKIVDKQSTKIKKFTLVCQNAKCKFQKIIVKKQLNEEDRTCPRCKKKMKIKEG